MIDSKIFNDDCEVLAGDIYKLGINNKTVLITGATGLLGRVLASSLILANNKYGTNNRIVLHARNLEKLQNIYGKDGDVDFVLGDIRQPLPFCGNVDYVFHLASVTSSKAMVEKPVEVIDTTVNGTLNILNFSKLHGAKKVVFTSTMEVFGNTNGIVAKEEDIGNLSLTEVRSSYPESKRMAENLCCCFAAEYGLDVSIARLTQTFGAGVDFNDKRIFSVIAKSVSQQKNIELASNGELVRDYCYSTDALSALLYILKFGESKNVYNVANPKTNTSVLNMATEVAKTFGNGQSNVVINIPDDVAKMGFSKPSITKLNVDKLLSLGWSPRYDLVDMYGRLLQYYNEMNSSELENENKFNVKN